MISPSSNVAEKKAFAVADLLLSVPCALAFAYLYHDFWWMQGFATAILVFIMSWAATSGCGQYLRRLWAGALCGFVAAVFLDGTFDIVLLVGASALIGAVQSLPGKIDEASRISRVIYRLIRTVYAVSILVIALIMWLLLGFVSSELPQSLSADYPEGRFNGVGLVVFCGMIIASLLLFGKISPDHISKWIPQKNGT